MATPVTITATMPSPAGSSAASDRAEDRQQHDQDDREAGGLGLLEVLLLEVLHAGPQRLLADDVRLDAVVDLADAAFLRRSFAASSASSREPVTASGIRTTAVLRRASPLAFAAAAAVSSTLSTFAAALSHAVDRRRHRGGVAALALRGRRRASRLLDAREALDRLVDARPSREPGTSKPPPVRCLVCLDGERERDQQEDEPADRDELTTPRTNADSRSMAACIRGLPEA